MNNTPKPLRDKIYDLLPPKSLAALKASSTFFRNNVKIEIKKTQQDIIDDFIEIYHKYKAILLLYPEEFDKKNVGNIISIGEHILAYLKIPRKNNFEYLKTITSEYFSLIENTFEHMNDQLDEIYYRTVKNVISGERLGYYISVEFDKDKVLKEWSTLISEDQRMKLNDIFKIINEKLHENSSTINSDRYANLEYNLYEDFEGNVILLNDFVKWLLKEETVTFELDLRDDLQNFMFFLNNMSINSNILSEFQKFCNEINVFIPYSDKSSQSGKTVKSHTNVRTSSQSGKTVKSQSDSDKLSKSGKTDQSHNNVRTSSQSGKTIKSQSDMEELSKSGKTVQSHTNVPTSSQLGKTSKSQSDIDNLSHSGKTIKSQSKLSQSVQSESQKNSKENSSCDSRETDYDDDTLSNKDVISFLNELQDNGFFYNKEIVFPDAIYKKHINSKDKIARCLIESIYFNFDMSRYIKDDDIEFIPYVAHEYSNVVENNWTTLDQYFNFENRSKAMKYMYICQDKIRKKHYYQKDFEKFLTRTISNYYPYGDPKMNEAFNSFMKSYTPNISNDSNDLKDIIKEKMPQIKIGGSKIYVMYNKRKYTVYFGSKGKFIKVNGVPIQLQSIRRKYRYYKQSSI